MKSRSVEPRVRIERSSSGEEARTEKASSRPPVLADSHYISGDIKAKINDAVTNPTGAGSGTTIFGEWGKKLGLNRIQKLGPAAVGTGVLGALSLFSFDAEAATHASQMSSEHGLAGLLLAGAAAVTGMALWSIPFGQSRAVLKITPAEGQSRV